jgi:Ni,Fe-hydrogenase III large subunit
VEAAFGHRLMMDCIVPGGLAADITDIGVSALTRAMAGVSATLPDIRQAFERSALATRLEGLGRISRAQADAFAAGGVVGRSAGRVFDARFFDGQVRTEIATAGDAAARCQLRLREIAASTQRALSTLTTLPEGPIGQPLPVTSGEGIGFAESARGDVWYWLRLDHGQIAAIWPRDPCWPLWPLLELALRGAAPEDVPVIQRSFGLTESGMDL